jgi:hypothetical protein
MDLPKGKPILCIDFDGVLHSYSSGWKGARCIPDPPVVGALDFLIDAVEHFQVNIYSSRSRYFWGRRAIKKWLVKSFVDIESIASKSASDNKTWSEFCKTKIYKWCADHFTLEPWPHDIIWAAKCLVKQIKFPTKKPAAFLQLDDRAMTFNGTFPSIEEMKAFKPWNKR